MATMKDVARRAGVSLSTVSYVLSGGRPISESTKNTVHRAMEELNFHPSSVARALASKRSRVLALLLSTPERGLGLSELEFVRVASQASRARGHHLVLLTEGMDSRDDLAHLKYQGLVDGVLLMEVQVNDPRVAFLEELGLPCSLLGHLDDASHAFVDIDFPRSFLEVGAHLSSLGHHRVTFVNQSREAFDTGNGPVVRAHLAVAQLARTLGWELGQEFCPPTPRDGWTHADRFLAGANRPTAVIVMNDRALPGVLQAASNRGLRIPQDLTVVSAITSAASASMMMPALTSADAPITALMRQAVDNLIARIEDPTHTAGNLLVPCTLTVRDSSGPARL